MGRRRHPLRGARLRIVGGTLGGRRFAGPASSATRATPERVREALASALESRDAIAGAHALDLFAGTGALAFECLSRGAADAVLVEQNRRAVAAIRRSTDELGLGGRVRLIDLDLTRRPETVMSRIAASASAPFDLVLADPPYAEVDRLGPLLAALWEGQLLAPGALVAVEHAARRPPSSFGGLAPVARYGYGDTVVVLAEAPPGGEGPPDGPDHPEQDGRPDQDREPSP